MISLTSNGCSVPIDEATQQRQLKRMRRVAAGLMLLMALLLAAARTLGSGRGAWPYLAAFAEAALVGGLADWFAVSALFRHPLGLKIPHTAIVPKNKDRLGASIGNFLQYNFMTREVAHAELAQVDFAGAAADWLAGRANSEDVAAQLQRALPAMLRSIDDAQARELMRSALAGAFEGIPLAPALARVLSLLVAGRQHLLLLERILGIVARALEQNRPYLRRKVHENSPRWLPSAVDDKLFERILEGVQAILIDIQGEDSAWRARFDQAAREMIARLAGSGESERKLHALLDSGAAHPAVRACIADVWHALKTRALDDCASPGSLLGARAAAALRALGAALGRDPALRARINSWLRALVADTIVERRDVLAAMVWRVINKWDAQTVSRKFELQVGKDLQYIRINGTLVGGVVGVLLHALG